jgi:hypothetical protein
MLSKHLSTALSPAAVDNSLLTWAIQAGALAVWALAVERAQRHSSQTGGGTSPAFVVCIADFRSARKPSSVTFDQVGSRKCHERPLANPMFVPVACSWVKKISEVRRCLRLPRNVQGRDLVVRDVHGHRSLPGPELEQVDFDSAATRHGRRMTLSTAARSRPRRSLHAYFAVLACVSEEATCA